jgi:UDP-N-acetylmuramoylalanine--D-glutamate ligase
MKLETLKDKKIIILGFGKEGRDTFKFLKKVFPKKVIGIGDQLKIKDLPKRSKKVKLHLGKNYLKAIKDYDIVIKTPGIPPKVIKSFLRKGQKITSQTEIFFENCSGRIVGITGTKGKSTTTSLAYKILKEGNVKAHLVGNIGKPVLEFLLSATPNDVYVYELSSHQLMNLKHSPHIAVFLNIYQEHLDYYRNFKEYLRAKQNICRWQSKNDFFIYNLDNKYVRETAKITKAKKIPIRISSIL